jgi:hypothetical protein
MLRFRNQLHVLAPSYLTRVRGTRSARPTIEPLEGRQLLSTIDINTAADNGSNTNPTPGSLRAAILQANAQPAGTLTMIVFDIGTGPQTIRPPVSLPEVTNPMFIDGTTQPGVADTPLITLDGSNAGSSAIGLNLGGSCTVQDLVIDDFARSGLVLGGSGSNVVVGDYIGTDRTGKLARPNKVGVTITSNGNVIGGTSQNVISGNSSDGVDLTGTSTNNLIINSLIGTDRTGEAPLGNLGGVSVLNTASLNMIGIEDSPLFDTTHNIISGNRGTGVSIGPGASGNQVVNDYIGTDAMGTVALGNGSNGVVVKGPSNIIGADPILYNVISGNGSNGVLITGAAASSNSVTGNHIGTDTWGTTALGNHASGLVIQSASYTDVFDNLIAGNRGDGVGVFWGADDNQFRYNFIGTNGFGTTGLGNGGDGLHITNSSYNTVGGTGSSDPNVISANGRNGVEIAGVNAGSTERRSILNSVVGNLIGTDLSGTLVLGNSRDGVYLHADATAPLNSYGNQIGYPSPWLGGDWGTVPPGYGNTITNSGSNGVEVTGVHMVGNPIRGNSIYANHKLGISLQPPASWNAPVLQGAQSGTTTVVQGYLTTSLTFPVTFSIDFYASATTDSGGPAQGRRYLGTVVVTANNGFVQFSADIAALTLPGEIITATATDYWGTTTEFSAGVTAQ